MQQQKIKYREILFNNLFHVCDIEISTQKAAILETDTPRKQFLDQYSLLTMWVNIAWIPIFLSFYFGVY
jgi:hypothetical protein